MQRTTKTRHRNRKNKRGGYELWGLEKTVRCVRRCSSVRSKISDIVTEDCFSRFCVSVGLVLQHRRSKCNHSLKLYFKVLGLFSEIL
jgi:hypothetical protein